MGNKEPLNSSENNPVESTPWDNIGDQFDPSIAAPEMPTPPDTGTPPTEVKPLVEDRDGNVQLGVSENWQGAELNGGTNDENTSNQENYAQTTPEATVEEDQLDYIGKTEADPYGGANGENTGDQVNQVE